MTAVPKTASVVECPCCGGDHEFVEFTPLTEPVDDKTHWGECPVDGGLVLMRLRGEDMSHLNYLLKKLQDQRPSEVSPE